MRRSRWFSPTKRIRRTAMARPAGVAPASARKGSTIVVVIALLLALTFLGIVGYTIGTQEHSNATYFSDAAKEFEFGVTRDSLFDWSLRQIILGTYQHEERQSALHGGHLSLLATMLGDNATPFDGEGVHMAYDMTDPLNPVLIVDQNYDGTDDAGAPLHEINRAPFSGGADAVIVDQSLGNGYPPPDVGYTYWDNNNPFLAYVNPEHVRDSSGNTVGVILSSYHRPQLLRHTGITADQWYTDPSTQRMVLRPHVHHRAIAENGRVTDTRRFVSALFPQAGLSSFPFTANTNPATDNINDGVWQGGDFATALANQANVKYDADADNDGIFEAIWMDLGYPMQTRENADGTVTDFVPLFAITIYDADALFNLNAHGNLAGLNNSFSNPFGTFGPTGPGADGDYTTADGVNDLLFASKSNQGFGVSEVNPEWGLLSNPADGSTLQHERFFGHVPVHNLELANMEWWFLVSGRGDLDASSNIDKLYPGRNGEIVQLDNAMQNALGVHSYPKAGETFAGYPDTTTFSLSNASHLRTDDNLDAQLGGRYAASGTYFPASVIFPAWRQPIDVHGSGRFTNPLPTTDARYGRQRFTQQSGQHQWPAYLGYQHNSEIGLWASTNTQFLMPSGSRRYNVDEPEETILEPDYVRSDLDSVFGADENAVLHLAQADQDILNLSGRLKDLAPVNFDGTDPIATAERRKRFTTTSWDLKTFGTTAYRGSSPPTAARAWETTTSYDAYVGTSSPFRSEIQALFYRDHDPVTAASQLAMARKISPNHLCVWEGAAGTSNLLFRPLTPHPEANSPYGQLSADPVNNQTTMIAGTSKPINIASAADQEWFARRDRQQLCRDIYTALYMYCGGKDVDYSTTSRPYPDILLNFDSDFDDLPDAIDQVQDDPVRMAQFVVNLVDRMDADDVITKFEFDIDLSNGWDVDDDPYGLSTNDGTSDFTPGTASIPPNGERGVVYGVERQKLALNEAQVIVARQVKDAAGINPQNHVGTEWDDMKNRDWTYIELENLTPEQIDFARESWQIAVKPGREIEDPMNPGQSLLFIAGDINNPAQLVLGEERRLTLTAPGTGTFVLQAGADSRLMLGTAGDKENVDMSGSPRPSHVMINVNDRDPVPGVDQGTFTRVTPQVPFDVPTPNTNVRDLLTASINLYQVHKAPSTGSGGDGAMIATDPSTDLLAINYPVDMATGMPDFDVIDDAMDRQIPVVFELRRRLNPLRTQPVSQNAGENAPNHVAQSEDNPWIVVDEFRIGMDVFQLNDPNEKYDKIQEQLTGKNPTTMSPTLAEKMASKERTQPLVRSSVHNHFVDLGGANDYQRNTLGFINRDTSNNIPSVYSQYQPHFNREFSSAMELMAVPLYSPADLTQELSESETWTPTDATSPPVIAANQFLHPEGIKDGSGVPIPDTGNRWYRLFEFVEVPDRSHRHPETNASGTPIRPAYVINLGNRATNPDLFYRRPGRLQLNTMRDPEVLGGLLDDPEVAQLDLVNASRHLPDQSTGAGSGPGRDWWVQFVQARDGVDPVTGMVLPGTPNAKPFKPFSYTVEGDQSLQSTLLRELPMDSSQSTRRGLFELGNRGQNVDHSVKYRMLEKVANNSTTRSNVFLIFIQVDFFEAAEVTDSGTGLEVVRVGGKLDDSPGYRGFFVVDRSKAHYLLGTGDFPQSFTDSIDSQPKFNYSFNQDFDFHQLILHRQTIN